MIASLMEPAEQILEDPLDYLSEIIHSMNLVRSIL